MSLERFLSQVSGIQSTVERTTAIRSGHLIVLLISIHNTAALPSRIYLFLAFELILRCRMDDKHEMMFRCNPVRALEIQMGRDLP